MPKPKKRTILKDEDEETKSYPDEEQGILPEESSEERSTDLKTGKRNEDVYSEEGRELLEEDDELEAWEAGFAQGADEEGQLSKDALTGEPLMGIEDVVEIKIDGQLYRFANDENAEKFRQKKLEEKQKGKKK